MGSRRELTDEVFYSIIRKPWLYNLVQMKLYLNCNGENYIIGKKTEIQML